MACDLIADFVVVGGGAGGAAAAAYLHRAGASAFVLSDGPDRTAALLDSPVRLTLYNQFGRFEQRGVRNTATGGNWQQITGAGGNNLHNGAVHQMPPLGRLDALLGGDGTARRAADWLARAGVATMVVGDTPECGDAAGADLRNLSFKYERGPMGCLPQQMYAYCADARVGCQSDSLHLALGGEARARGRTDGFRKTTMYSDLLKPDLNDSVWVLHETRGEQLRLAHGRVVSVRASSGDNVCARGGVVLAGGVWGTAEVLMRTLGRTELGGLWEQTVLPLAPGLDPSLVSMADCADDLRTGNLHLAGRTRPQAEFTICAANAAEGRSSPVLLAAWIIGMNATERGNVSLQDPATDRVSGSLPRAAPAVMEEAARAIFAELRARYGSDLVLPVVSAAFTMSTHHLGGGLRGVASAGRVHGLDNVFVGDMSAYDDDVWGYTTGAAAVAGVTAAMRALEEAERHSAALGPPTLPKTTLHVVVVVATGVLVWTALCISANGLRSSTRL
jgi:choline dehydrogenase-like flavoprotein